MVGLSTQNGGGSAMEASLPCAPGDNPGLPGDLESGRLSARTVRVLQLLPVHPGPDVSTAAVAALTDLPIREARNALECLVRAQVVETVSTGEERWKIHTPAPSRTQWLSDEFAAEVCEQARDRLLDYYLVKAEAADRMLRELPPVSEEFADRNEALAWLDAEHSCLVAVVGMAADTGRDEVAKCLPLLMAYYLGFRSLFDDLLAVTTVSLGTARRLYDRTTESEALTNLGLALWGLRRYDEAVIAHREAVALFQEIDDRRGEGDALNNLGIALHGLGQDEEALSVHQNAAAIFRDTGERLGEGKALNNLGLALCSLREFDDAVIAHRGAAEIFRETGYEYEEANALANLGNDFRDLSLSDQAIAAYQEAADIFRQTGDVRNELIVLQSLEMSRQA